MDVQCLYVNMLYLFTHFYLHLHIYVKHLFEGFIYFFYFYTFVFPNSVELDCK